MTEFSWFMPLQAIAPINSWLAGVSLKVNKIILKKNKGNENKLILGDFNCTADEMGRDGGTKTQRLYRCCSNYALPKLIVDNELKDLWRRENPDSPEFTHCDRFFGKDPGQTGSILI